VNWTYDDIFLTGAPRGWVDNLKTGWVISLKNGWVIWLKNQASKWVISLKIHKFVGDQWLDDEESEKLHRLRHCLSRLGWAPGE
jgi:hypothetical protein